MATVDVYNLEGKKVSDITLDDAIFGVEIDQTVVQLVSNVQRANAHVPYAHTKGRADVRGGGKKPWKQKGTGRARHGSSRSPIWKGGGVTFGPTKLRNMFKKVNKKTKRKALNMVLTDIVQENRMIVLESIDGIEGKTKQLATLLNTLPTKGSSVLVASAVKNESLKRAAKNLQKVNTTLADSLNVRDLMKYTYFVVDTAGIEQLSELNK